MKKIMLLASNKITNIIQNCKEKQFQREALKRDIPDMMLHLLLKVKEVYLGFLKPRYLMNEDVYQFCNNIKSV